MTSRQALLRASTTVAISLGTVAAACSGALAIVALSGHSITETTAAFWAGAFGSPQAVASTLDSTIPLVLVALGWILAVSARRLNIGFEGQILAGGVLATLIALKAPELPHSLHLPLAAAAGALGGALWAGIAAGLQVLRNVNELLSTFMLNFIAALFVGYLVRGPLQEPTGNLLQTERIPESAAWPGFGLSDLAWDVLLVPVFVLAAIFILRYTTLGFRLRILRGNPEVATAIGMRARWIGAWALIASGGLAGLAGGSLILSSRTGAMQDGFSAHYGFEGIAVALLARNSPLACIPAALLFGALRTGSSMVETRVGLAAAVADISVGLIIVLVAGSSFLLMLARKRADRGDPPIRLRLRKPAV